MSREVRGVSVECEGYIRGVLLGIESRRERRNAATQTTNKTCTWPVVRESHALPQLGIIQNFQVTLLFVADDIKDVAFERILQLLLPAIVEVVKKETRGERSCSLEISHHRSGTPAISPPLPLFQTCISSTLLAITASLSGDSFPTSHLYPDPL